MPDKENKQEGQQPREKRKYNLTKPRPSKKEQIIQGAIKAMCFYGYDGATMEKIALNAGVSKALIGRHFGSKENLAGVCLKRIFEQFFERAKSIAEKSADYREQTDKMFMLFQSSLPELRLFISLLAIPALEHIAKENLPFLSSNTHNVVGINTPTDEKNLAALSYTMIGLYFNFALTGRENLYREAKEHVLQHYLEETN